MYVCMDANIFVSAWNQIFRLLIIHLAEKCDYDKEFSTRDKEIHNLLKIVATVMLVIYTSNKTKRMLFSFSADIKRN